MASAVVLLHGWPGLPSDYDGVREALGDVRVVVPDLLGFGHGYDGPFAEGDATADAHARRVLAQLDDDGVRAGAVIGGYDIGSRIAQAALRLDPLRFSGAVLTPGYPGIGDRAGAPELAATFWYQHFLRDPIATRLIDGNRDAVHDYLGHIWEIWSSPGSLSVAPNERRLVDAYARPGAFAASVQWYRANRGYAGDYAAIQTPTTMLWPTADPLFPLEWADRVGEYFTNATVLPVEGVGHFVPIEASREFANAIREFACDEMRRAPQPRKHRPRGHEKSGRSQVERPPSAERPR
ncbi:alpha/beta fold hydrolase [Demequina oxidasica]|uniref:alpha/beta fold hydrolase n=1 Tax=Demequina oxidasica TaxID=676199 RepID=UPI000A001F9E|nr:alpha/beta hydrolase [Demequina oxidasica]